MREFLYVDDLADAVCFALENKLPENLYNIGTGKDLTIKELAELIQKVTVIKERSFGIVQNLMVLHEN